MFKMFENPSFFGSLIAMGIIGLVLIRFSLGEKINNVKK